jgi:hypothetical protein
MIWACDGHAPGPNVTTVTAPTGLLRNKERDVVVCVICGVEAAGAKDATVIECAIPGRSLLARSQLETHRYA